MSGTSPALTHLLLYPPVDWSVFRLGTDPNLAFPSSAGFSLWNRQNPALFPYVWGYVLSYNRLARRSCVPQDHKARRRYALLSSRLFESLGLTSLSEAARRLLLRDGPRTSSRRGARQDTQRTPTRPAPYTN